MVAEICSIPTCDLNTTFNGWLSCNYQHMREDHPINHVDWDQVRTFALWVGADIDLPTEAQWEYAARSGDLDYLYPWGDQDIDCNLTDYDHSEDDVGCNGRGTSPVCTYSDGHSAQGVCDLIGNIGEWVLDNYFSNYLGAPVDGSARCEEADCSGDGSRSVRGGSWNTNEVGLLPFIRSYGPITTQGHHLGGRLVKFQD